MDPELIRLVREQMRDLLAGRDPGELTGGEWVRWHVLRARLGYLLEEMREAGRA